MLKVKPERSKIFMICRKKVFRVFDRLLHSLHTGGCGAGERARDALPDGVKKVGGHSCRFRDIWLFMPQLRAFLGLFDDYSPKFFRMRKIKIDINPHKSISNIIISSNQPPEGWFRIVNTNSSGWLDEIMKFDIDLCGLMSIFIFLMLKIFGEKSSKRPKKALRCGTKSQISRKRALIGPTFCTPSGSASRALPPAAVAPVCNECGRPSKTRNTFFRLIMKIFDCSGLTFSIKTID